MPREGLCWHQTTAYQPTVQSEKQASWRRLLSPPDQDPQGSRCNEREPGMRAENTHWRASGCNGLAAEEQRSRQGLRRATETATVPCRVRHLLIAAAVFFSLVFCLLARCWRRIVDAGRLCFHSAGVHLFSPYSSCQGSRYSGNARSFAKSRPSSTVLMPAFALAASMLGR